MTTTLADQATYFRSLHTPDAPLALPNVWDAGSTVVVESAGARAVATTSAGVAWSVGAADGDRLTRRQAVDALRRVTAVARTPVTADVESGYAAAPDEVAGTIREVVDAGAVGVNLEDGDRDPGELAHRLRVARRTADELGVRLFLNARTDVFLRGIGPGAVASLAATELLTTGTYGALADGLDYGALDGLLADAAAGSR